MLCKIFCVREYCSEKYLFCFMEKSVEFCLKAFWWKSDFIHAWESLLNFKMFKEIQNHFSVFEIMKECFFLVLTNVKKPSTSNIPCFLSVILCFWKKLFYLKNCKWKELGRIYNLRFIFYRGSCVHSSWRKSTEWREFCFFPPTSYFLPFSITICLHLLGIQS